MINEIIQKFYEIDIWLAIIVFFTYIAMDALYCLYTIAITKRNKVQAANFGCMMYLLVGVGTISYVDNYWYLLPVAMGAWLGNYYSMGLIAWYENRKPEV